MIEHFVQSMPESVLKYRLSKELRAGRSVKLSQYPSLKERWEAFLEIEITELFSQWLTQLGIEARIVPSSEME